MPEFDFPPIPPQQEPQDVTFDLSGTPASQVMLATRIDGDPSRRFTLAADGTMSWGPGNGATDVSLARSSAGVLTVTGSLAISTGVPGQIPFYGTNGLINQSSSFFWDNANARETVGNAWIYTPGTINLFIGNLAGNLTTTAIRSVGIGGAALQSVTSGTENTAVGYGALFSSTSGGFNTAMGYEALYSNVGNTGNVAMGYAALTNCDASNNTAIGYGSMQNATLGGNNTAVGYGSLLANTASGNTAVGYSAASLNTDGNQNVAIGYNASYSNIHGVDNVAVGWGALFSNTTSNNTACGYAALYNATTGGNNTALGTAACYHNTIGINNIGIGFNALLTNDVGNYNIAVGSETLTVCTGSNNTAVGHRALYTSTTGNYNTGIGWEALYNSIGAQYNTALGYQALFNITTGQQNTALGLQAGYNAGTALATNANCVFIGYLANSSVDGLSNAIAIGSTAQATASNQVILGNTSITSIGIGTSTPRRMLDILSTSTQLRLTYTDNSVYTDFQTNSSGTLVITPTNSAIKVPQNCVFTPATDATAAIRFNNAANTKAALWLDTTNGRAAIGGTTPAAAYCHIQGDAGIVAQLRLQNTGATNPHTWDIGPEVGAANRLALAYDITNTALRLSVYNTGGSVLVGSAALATNATDGFLYIPTCAGAPTGAPTAFTGLAPIIYDTTNNKIWFYSGAWRGVVVA